MITFEETYSILLNDMSSDFNFTPFGKIKVEFIFLILDPFKTRVLILLNIKQDVRLNVQLLKFCSYLFHI